MQWIFDVITLRFFITPYVILLILIAYFHIHQALMQLSRS